MPLIAKEERFC